MNQDNLMHINSNNIGVMDNIGEYQRLFINDIVGKPSNDRLKSKRMKILSCKFDNIEDIWATLEEKYDCYSINLYKMHIIHDDFLATIVWQYESTHTGLLLTLSADSIKKANNYINEISEYLSSFIINEKLVSYTVLQHDNSEIANETFYQESLEIDFNPVATPFIKNVDTYIENFLNSKAPLLILQGEPGTGKTTFLKYILKAMQEKVFQKKEDFHAIYSFDENLFYLSDFYRRIIYDTYDVLVLEDINQVLYKNQDDDKLNPINKFLSVTDGLISKYKKIIITTNIESRAHINPALLRPGRCYDVIPFRKLEGIEIDNLCDSCAKDLNLQTESINLSEFYAKLNGEQNSVIQSNKVGFFK